MQCHYSLANFRLTLQTDQGAFHVGGYHQNGLRVPRVPHALLWLNGGFWTVALPCLHREGLAASLGRWDRGESE